MTEEFKPKFDSNGLMAGIIQDADTGEVLMIAFMNRQALDKTIETGKAHFYSRSRDKLWMKGEQSGHTQNVVEMRFDCDQDACLMKVRQSGAACHEGYRSCFYRTLEGGELKVVEQKVFDPDKVYGQ